MGDGPFKPDNSGDNKSGRTSRFGDYIPRLAGEAFPPPPAADAKQAGQPNPAADKPLPGPGAPAGVPGTDGTKIKPGVTNEEVLTPPPDYTEALEWQRGRINDKAAERNRTASRVLQWLWNTTLAYRGARYVEPPNLAERTQLQTIERAIAGSPGPGITRLVRDREYIMTGIQERGRWRGPLGVLSVSVADWAVDQVVFPKDHIKYGTLLADFGGATWAMFIHAPWRYKAAAMVGMHTVGRIYDHFIQGREATNAHKPRPPWENPDIGRAINGAGPESGKGQKAPEAPVYRPPNAGLQESQSEIDRRQRESNANQQKQSQEEAQRRYQAYQEALNKWRLEHPGASDREEGQFMRAWFRQNRR